MMHRFTIAMLFAMLLSGCATTARVGTQSVDSLQLDLSSRKAQQFYLYDANRRLISRAISSAGRLRIELPPNRDIAGCVQVLDQRGKSILPDGTRLKLSVRNDYASALAYRESSDTQYSEQNRRLNNLKSQQNSALGRLTGNRAYTNRRCSRPPERSAGPQPIVKCGSYEECLRDAKLICYSRFVGAKGCGKVASEYQIPNIVSGPTCAAFVAEMAGAKYELEDAVVDFLFGIADDAADDLMNSDSAADVIAGLIVGTLSNTLQLEQAKSCSTEFVNRQFGPMQTWLQEVQRLGLEPDNLLQACDRDVNAYLAATSAITAADSQVTQLTQSLAQADARLRELARTTRSIEWCR
jgi:hypothetical protein